MPGNFPDAMADIRAWARAHSELNPLHGGRVFFRWPNGLNDWPSIRIYDFGTVQPGEVPLVDLRVSFEITGRPVSATTGGGTFADVSALRWAVVDACHNLAPGRIGSGATYVGNVSVTGMTPSPDPDTGAARYIVDTLWTLRASGASDIAA